MKALNQKSTEIFLKLIDLLEKQGEENHIKIDNTNGSFMPLSFEKLNELVFFKFPAVRFAMAHYFELNGDLVPDPDMTFIYVPEKKQVFAASIQNQFYYREGIYQDDNGVWKYRPIEQADEANFAMVWLHNIKEQQGI